MMGDFTQQDPLTTTWEVESTTSARCNDHHEQYHYIGARQLAVFHDWYQNYHGYLATIVCLFGIVANTANIVVLSRRNMVSATNCILTGLAVADGLTMAVYLPFALQFYVLYGTTPSTKRNSFPAVSFLMFYASFSVVVHTVAIWLTVVLAVFRYVFIRYPRHGAEWCSLARSKLAIGLVHLVTLIVCIPNFTTMTFISSGSSEVNASAVDTCKTTQLEHNASISSTANGISALPSVTWNFDDVTPGVVRDDDVNGSLTVGATEEVIWNVDFKSTTPSEKFMKSLNFWIQALLVKLVPCVGLTVLSLLLVQTMKEAEARRQNLRAKVPPSAVGSSNDRKQKTQTTNQKKDEISSLVTSTTAGSNHSGRDRKTNRTTRMLLVVVVLFIVTEFPQGIINLLSGMLDHFYLYEIYMPLGDLLDILALINNGINFILYCTMSKQFRDTFVSCFHLESTVHLCSIALSGCFGKRRQGIDNADKLLPADCGPVRLSTAAAAAESNDNGNHEAMKLTPSPVTLTEAECGTNCTLLVETITCSEL